MESFIRHQLERGYRIETNHSHQPRTLPFDGLSIGDSWHEKIMPNVSVVDHFRYHHHFDLENPHLPCMVVLGGSGGLVGPASVAKLAAEVGHGGLVIPTLTCSPWRS